MLETVSGRSYGIEMEFKKARRDEVAAAIRSVGIDARVVPWGHEVRGFWGILTDASVCEGAYPNYTPQSGEIVSPVLRGNAGLQEIEAVCQALRQTVARVDKDCGLHVHHWMGDLRIENWKAFAKRYIKFEPVMDRFMPGSRRGDDTTSYIRSNRERVLRYTNDLYRSTRSYPRTLREAFELINTARDLTSLAVIMNGPQAQRLLHHESRYHKLNLQSYFRQQTGEFRHHSGTLNAGKIIHWVCLTQSLVEDSLLRTKVEASCPGRTARRAEGQSEERILLEMDFPALFKSAPATTHRAPLLHFYKKRMEEMAGVM